MTDALRERAMDALSRVVPPGIDKSLVELGFVKSVEPSDDGVLTVSLGLRAPHVRRRSLIEKACREAGMLSREIRKEEPPEAHVSSGDLGDHVHGGGGSF